MIHHVVDIDQDLPVPPLAIGVLQLVRFDAGNGPCVGWLDGRAVTELATSWTAALGLLADGDTAGLLAARTGPARARAEVELLLPVAGGADVYCVGLNYLEHQVEAADLVDELPEAPIIFVKTPRALAPPDADLVLPAAVSGQFDWEVELGVVIGHGGWCIPEAEAWRHVAGYTVVNDVTARDLQRLHQQWHLGKNVVASTPVGPGVVARDAVGTPPDLAVTLKVNGVLKQTGRTSQLIHSIPALVALVSGVCGLRAGDVIATGTPAGVGFKRVPPEFLREGDQVEAAIEGIGALVNVVRTGPLA